MKTEVIQANTDQKIQLCFDVMQELRPYLEKDSFVERISRLTPHGYQLIYIENENGKVAAVAGFRFTELLHWGKAIYIDEVDKDNKLVNRQQKNTLLLKDVGYRIWAKMEFRSVSKRKAEGELFSHEPGKDENPMKYYQMFERRASKGQCFNQPYLGTREFSASFRLVNPDDDTLTPPISEEQGGTKDLGIMLYDMDFADKKNIQPMFYRPQMKDGVIIVPPINSEEILK